jgi:hypothetical protein
VELHVHPSDFLNCSIVGSFASVATMRGALGPSLTGMDLRLLARPMPDAEPRAMSGLSVPSARCTE